jgi:hypothetical protein
MNTSWVWRVWVALAAGIFNAGEIRGDEPPVTLFAIPKIELRKGAVAEVATREVGGMKADEAVEELSVTTGRSVAVSEISIQVYETMNGESVLSRMEMPDEPGGALGWLQTEILDPVFSLEVVKVGKVQMSGGVVAAIRRKNPFCLLHPLVFVASR